MRKVAIAGAGVGGLAAGLALHRCAFAAMGANMTIEDVGALVPALKKAQNAESALAEFETSRKKRAEDVVSKGQKMARLTQLHSSFAAWLRDEAFLHMPADETERVTREMAGGE